VKTFANFLTEAIQKLPRRPWTPATPPPRAARGAKGPPAPISCHDHRGRICPICWAGQFLYPQEVEAREIALAQYWQTLRTGCQLEKLRPSPLGRNYRTISKRRWTKSALCLLERNLHGRLEPWKIPICDVEPTEHAAIFAHLQDKLLRSPVREGLRFAVIRGDYRRFCVLLNLENLDHGALNRLSKSILETTPQPHAIFAFQGAANSDYYLEQSQAHDRLHRLHGPTWQKVDLVGRHFRYHPLAFCQINQALTSQLVEEVEACLGETELPLLDLYCGFGLFSFGLSRKGPSLGVESNPWSIRSARENAKYLADGRKADFLARELTGESVPAILKHWGQKEFSVILDPPRGGTTPGVIEALAAYAPKRVVHLVCDIERTQLEITRWNDSGYRLERALPFDMFPGTSEVELALVLTHQKSPASPTRAAQKRQVKGISLRVGEKSRTN
jgi:tRNA/tmRNA/rRNA uracil-C5-methylase (TrmA/RlmC/RlmD family)